MSQQHDVAIVLRADHRSNSSGNIRDYLVPQVEVIEVPGTLLTRSHLRRAVASWRPAIVHTHLRRGTRLIAQIDPAAAHIASLHLSINGPHFLCADGLHCISHWQVASVPPDYKVVASVQPSASGPKLIPCAKTTARQFSFSALLPDRSRLLSARTILTRTSH